MAVVLFTASIFFVSCRADRAEIVDYFEGFRVPKHFPPPVYNNPKNPVTKQGFELGRMLFHDPILSRDSTISCASCHAQSDAFSDKGMPFSLGVDGLQGSRNSPTMSNLAWFPAFMWDGGINHLEIMPFAPITEPLEMDEDLNNIMHKLQRQNSYQVAFEKAFGPNQFTDQKLFYALAQFMSLMISDDSKYDKYILGKASFTLKEKHGLELFRTHCESCHKEPLFTDFSYANMGLDYKSIDPGRGRITQQAQDSGAFKVPTLRNIELTYPYMHDGRFSNLDQVLNHYTSGIKQNGLLDPRLSENISLSTEEQDALLTFLYTLTDQTFLTNKNLGNPFE